MAGRSRSGTRRRIREPRAPLPKHRSAVEKAWVASVSCTGARALLEAAATEMTEPLVARVLFMAWAAAVCGAVVGCGSAGGAASPGPDAGGANPDSGAGVHDAAPDGAASDGPSSDAPSPEPDSATPDSGSPDGTSDNAGDAAGLLPRCFYTDASNAPQCATGLSCVLNGSCDPPAAPNCGQLCVDCNHPPAGLAIPEGMCSQQCSPPCTAPDVCVGTQAFVAYAGDGGTCPAGAVLAGPYCEAAPTFACAPSPPECGATLTCGCAKSLCTSSHECESISVRQINCIGTP
jgi:hypothetical protein